LRKCERQHVPVVVVGVLADQVEPTRGSPDTRWLPGSPTTEGFSQGAGIVAHATHCIGPSHLTTSNAGPRP
jgi:hypothetical protein